MEIMIINLNYLKKFSYLNNINNNGKNDDEVKL